MSWSLHIGKLLGSEIRIHATFFLLLAWIGGAAWLRDGPEAAAANVAFVSALFLCVLAHEFGHALAARRYGIRTPDITLLPIGGLARLERLPAEPAREVAVALAGPAVNVAIWLVLSLVLGAGGTAESLEALDDPSEGFLARLAAVNLFLAVFNLLPAFPMDGGRVLRALLATRLSRLQATKVAAGAGQTVAFLFGLLGLAGGNPLLLLVAVFVFFAAAAERSDVALHDKAKGVRAREVMITSFEALRPQDTLGMAADAVVRTTQHEFPVVDGDGRLEGVLTRSALIAGLAAQSRDAPVARSMTPSIPCVAANAPLDAVLERLSDADTPAVAVADASGRLLGYVTRENIGEWMALN